MHEVEAGRKELLAGDVRCGSPSDKERGLPNSIRWFNVFLMQPVTYVPVRARCRRGIPRQQWAAGEDSERWQRLIDQQGQTQLDQMCIDEEKTQKGQNLWSGDETLESSQHFFKWACCSTVNCHYSADCLALGPNKHPQPTCFLNTPMTYLAYQISKIFLTTKHLMQTFETH